MVMKLAIEASPRGVLFVYFEQDEDTGAWVVKDLRDYGKRECIKRGPYQLAFDYDYPLPNLDATFESIVIRYDGQHVATAEDEGRSARELQRFVLSHLALIICEFLGCYDQDGSIIDYRSPGEAVPGVMEAFLAGDEKSRECDFGPYLRLCE